MSRQQQDEYEAHMFHTYSDFASACETEGFQNVLQDLEDHYNSFYTQLIQSVIERARINKDVPCALLRKGD